MAEKTGIAWCDSTRNFWTGCTKIGPGCDGCYAEAFDRWTSGKDPETGESVHWGPGRPREPHLDGAARDLRRWNRRAAEEIAAGTRRVWRVFINSQSDFFDNEVEPAWREYAWSVIRECRALTFLLLTKRIGNVRAMLPADWGGAGYPNVWIGATVVNQEEADRDLPKLLGLPATVRWVSYEPALGPIDFRRWLEIDRRVGSREWVRSGFSPEIDWIIVGGESTQAGHPARPFELAFARSTIEQCRAAGVACFVKQLGDAISVPNDSGGEWPDEDAFGDAIPDQYWPQYQGEHVVIRLREIGSKTPSAWPRDLRVQEFPA